MSAKDLHFGADLYAGCKHANVVRWVNRSPRFHVHDTPPRSTWPNIVVGVIRDLAEARLPRGVFRSVPELMQAPPSLLSGRQRPRLTGMASEDL